MGQSGTDTHNSGKSFPTTRWTVLKDASDPSSPHYRESLEHLARTYWRPIYAHFRRKWKKSEDEARDLTQDFFTALCEKDFLKHLSAEHGRFRSYVMAALDNFVRLEYRLNSRQKRGGGAARISLDIVEDFEPAPNDTPEQSFLREWARSVLAEAIEELERDAREDGQTVAFEIFVLRDIRPPREGPPSYESLARRFSVSVVDVTNFLFRARKKLRELVLKRVRDTVSSDSEAEAEMRDLFEGRDPR